MINIQRTGPSRTCWFFNIFFPSISPRATFNHLPSPFGSFTSFTATKYTKPCMRQTQSLCYPRSLRQLLSTTSNLVLYLVCTCFIPSFQYSLLPDVVFVLGRDGELVLMDAGSEYHGYASDITRTWPVGGKFSDAQRELYELVLRVHKKCLKVRQILVPKYTTYYACTQKKQTLFPAKQCPRNIVPAYSTSDDCYAC